MEELVIRLQIVTLNTQLFGDSRIRPICTVKVLGLDDVLLVCHSIKDSRQYMIPLVFETLELSEKSDFLFISTGA